jgi:uncharacterized membrane protein YcaP (DUF421 family)
MNDLLSDWHELLRMLIVGTIAYAAVLILLRSFGKRALAKMSAYDFVTTVALGSALASAVLSKDATIDKAVLAFALLLSLQRFAAWLSIRWDRMRVLINNEPTLLVRDGALLPRAMERERVSRADIESAVRSSGHCGLAQVSAVILETDGSMSVLAAGDGALRTRSANDSAPR